MGRCGLRTRQSSEMGRERGGAGAILLEDPKGIAEFREKTLERKERQVLRCRGQEGQILQIRRGEVGAGSSLRVWSCGPVLSEGICLSYHSLI